MSPLPFQALYINQNFSIVVSSKISSEGEAAGVAHVVQTSNHDKSVLVEFFLLPLFSLNSP
jgi:hypothetical protein